MKTIGKHMKTIGKLLETIRKLSKAIPLTSKSMRLDPRGVFWARGPPEQARWRQNRCFWTPGACFEPGAVQSKYADVNINAFGPPGLVLSLGPSRASPLTSKSMLLDPRGVFWARGPPEQSRWRQNQCFWTPGACYEPGALQSKAADVKIDAFGPPGPAGWDRGETQRRTKLSKSGCWGDGGGIR